MRRTARLVPLVVVLTLSTMLLLAGCINTAPLTLSESDTRTTQALRVGQQLKVELEANPTTGYQWTLDRRLPPQLEQVGKPQFKADSPALGSGGTEVWTFVAKERGAASIALKCWRSFDPTSASASSFSVDVHVR